MSMKPADIDDYISTFPPNVQEALQLVRRTLLETVPNAEETISYNMPTLTLNGACLVHFAAFKKHIGMYAVPTGHPDFEEALAPYVQGRGSIQFPLNKPIPVTLIRAIAEFNEQKITIL